MGGQNHQPTGTKITAASAWLSQNVGKGFALVLEANNHLENAIMLGMKKLYIEDLTPFLGGTPEEHIEKTITALSQSVDTLEKIQLGFTRLQEVAEIIRYKGNPLSPTIKEHQLKEKFEGVLVKPYCNGKIWEELENHIQEDNILNTLKWEADQFKELCSPTEHLISILLECKRIAQSEGGQAMADAIENNEVPLRQYYAQVFSLWNTLHAMFLYSALMMTELFYQVNAFPSLLEFDPASKEIIVA